MEPLVAYDYALIVLPFVSYWTLSLLFMIGEWTGFLSQYVIQKGGFADPTKQRVSRTKVVVTVLAQHTAAIILCVLVAQGDGSCVNRELPAWWVALLQVIATMVFIDTWLYWWHRLFHVNRFLYKHFHSWHHDIYAPYCFSGQFNHPVEGFILDNVSGAIPMIVLDMHPLVACSVFTLGVMKNVDDHCGYKIPWDPFQFIFTGNNAAFHDSHHRLQGTRFNYSQPFFAFWDHLGGTYKDPEKVKID